jgi:type I restriction-modification system DNA methylase subunit
MCNAVIATASSDVFITGISTTHFKQQSGGIKTFDYVVANPPFSTKEWSNGFDPANDQYARFTYGIPPAKNGDNPLRSKRVILHLQFSGSDILLQQAGSVHPNRRF